jgi:hypothetical protein
MSDGQDPATKDRERLEHFLEWRRAESKRRSALGRRRLLSVAGTVALAVVAVALVMWWAARALETRERVASAMRRVPAATRGAPAAGATTPSFKVPGPASPQAPPAIVTPRSAPGDRAPEQDWAGVERAPAVERPPGATRRTPPIALPARRSADSVREAHAPRQQATSKDPRVPASDDNGQPSDLSAAVGPPPPAVRVPEGPIMRPPMPHAPRGVAADTPGEGLTAAAPSSLPAPPPPLMPAVGLPPTPHVPIAEASGDRKLETLKRLVGYIPEVRAGKAIIRWIKSQPPVDAAPRQPEPQPPQAR